MTGFTAATVRPPILLRPRAMRWPIDRVGSNRHGDDPMITMKRAHLFGGPKRMRRAKERTERVQLLTASARERAMELAQEYKEGNSTAREGGDEHSEPSR